MPSRRAWRPRVASVRLHLMPRASHQEQEGVRPLIQQLGVRFQEHVDALVALEGTGIGDDRVTGSQGYLLRADRVPCTRLVLEADFVGDRVLDQEKPRDIGFDRHRILSERRRDRDDRIGPCQTRSLQEIEEPDQQARAGEIEIPQLLGQARVHVVHELEVEQRLQVTEKEHALLVSMNEVVPVADQESDRP
jgi:hypothetical protein